jgi:hypothetical protein
MATRTVPRRSASCWIAIALSASALPGPKRAAAARARSYAARYCLRPAQLHLVAGAVQLGALGGRGLPAAGGALQPARRVVEAPARLRAPREVHGGGDGAVEGEAAALRVVGRRGELHAHARRVPAQLVRAHEHVSRVGAAAGGVQRGRFRDGVLQGAPAALLQPGARAGERRVLF